MELIPPNQQMIDNYEEMRKSESKMFEFLTDSLTMFATAKKTNLDQNHKNMIKILDDRMNSVRDTSFVKYLIVTGEDFLTLMKDPKCNKFCQESYAVLMPVITYCRDEMIKVFDETHVMKEYEILQMGFERYHVFTFAVMITSLMIHTTAYALTHNDAHRNCMRETSALIINCANRTMPLPFIHRGVNFTLKVTDKSNNVFIFSLPMISKEGRYQFTLDDEFPYVQALNREVYKLTVAPFFLRYTEEKIELVVQRNGFSQFSKDGVFHEAFNATSPIIGSKEYADEELRKLLDETELVEALLQPEDVDYKMEELQLNMNELNSFSEEIEVTD